MWLLPLRGIMFHALDGFGASSIGLAGSLTLVDASSFGCEGFGGCEGVT